MPGKKPDDARRDTTAEVNSPRPVVATRTFEPPKIARQEPVQVTLNSTPLPTGDALSPKPALPVLPFPTPSAAPPPPPAPATVAAKPAEPARPRFGRLIWTGELDRNALLTLSSSGASLGWANGKLPGFPITISLHPADLVAGGIQVFTRDQKLVSRAEPPSAENGWNTIVYKYDPKTAPDVHVIQPPSAANSWNQLVVQNGKKPISVIVIDWQRAADSH
jgi:hypothetical protein